VKQRDIVFFQQTGKALLSFANDDNPFRYRAHLSFDLDLKACRNLLQKFALLFGEVIENDSLYIIRFSAERYLKMVGIHHQWDAGTTRIIGGCSGSQNPEEVRNETGKVSGSFFFTHISRQEKLEAPIVLRCSQKLSFSNGGDGSPQNDIVLTVNVLFKQVTNTAGSRLDSSGFEADEAHFGFTREDIERKVTSRWRIDRVTGVLRVEMMSQGGVGATTGTCERLKKLEKKF